MSDLRRRALGGGKTVSRKARSKAESGLSSASHSPNGSPANSRPGSRPSSHPGSRYASEDEYASDSDNDDVMTIDTNSVSGEEDATNTWAERLQDRVTELQDRKRSSVQGREATLGGYNHLLKHHVAQRQLERSAADVMSILLKDIKNGSSEEERLRAIKAFTLTVLTCPSDTIFAQALPVLKSACHDSEADEEAIKVETIRALSVSVTYGGGSSHAAEEVLDFLLEIVESDGHSVDAADSGPVVTAALQAWAFVASHMEDLTVQFEAAIEAFVEQLDSSDPEVQTSAGVNIALLFESARDCEEETGESFDLQYNQHRIITRMSEIVRDTSKTVSKKERRNLRFNFSSIVTSLERGKGPGYSTAGRSGPNPHTGVSNSDWGEFREFGYREKIRVYNQFLLIDTWSLHARVEVLKSLLGGGFGVHYLENPVVRDILSGVGIEYLGARKAKK